MKFNRAKIAQFQEQNCTLTLKEAVAEFYSVNAHIFSPPEADTIWTEFLVHHDVCHVFFGVNTTIFDEMGGDYWTLFGTDISFKEYWGYIFSPDGKKVVENIGSINIIKSLFWGIPLLIRVYFRSRKMSHKWAARDYQEYMNTPLSEVRKIHQLTILEYSN